MMNKLKLFLFLLVFWQPLNSDIINGDDDPIGVPRDLSLNPIVAGPSTDPLLTTSIKNHILTRLSGDNLVTSTRSSLLHLKDTYLELDGTYTFTHGAIEIVGTVEIGGSGHKFRFGSHSLLIAAGSELIIGPGVEFEFAPTSSLMTAVRFESSSSKLTLKSSTLTVSNNLGMLLLEGNLCIEGNSIIDNTSTNTNKALILGNNFTGTNATGDGDCKLTIKPGAKLTVKNAGIRFKNNGAGSFDSSQGQGTLVVEKGSNFLFDSIADFGSDGPTLNFSTLSGKVMRGAMNSGTLVDQERNRRNLAGDPDSRIFWSPSGKFISRASNTAPQVEVYSFDETGSLGDLGTAAQRTLTTFGFSSNWSPDGQFLAIGESSHAGTEIYVYQFDGTQLIDLPGTQLEGGDSVPEVRFSPDGRYLATVSTAANDVRIYFFDGVSLTLKQTLSGVGSSVAWSPSGKHLFVGLAANVKVYAFNANDSSLTLLDTLTTAAEAANRVKWSPVSNYVSSAAEGTDNVRVYKFDENSLSLVASLATGETVGPIIASWSILDGRMAIGNFSSTANEIELVKFHGNSLTFLSINKEVGSRVSGLAWSPDGNNLASSQLLGSPNFTVWDLSYANAGKEADLKDVTFKLSQDLELTDINLQG